MNRGFLFFLVVGIIVSLIVIGMTIMVYGDNVKNTDTGFYDIYIPSGIDYNAVVNLLEDSLILKNTRTFEWVAERMNYPNTVEAGKYTVPNLISNRALVTQLRNGYSEQPVKLALHTINSKNELYTRVSNVLECDSAELAQVFENDSILTAYSLNQENGWSTILCDTYQFNWDTDALEFFDRMLLEFNSYWNDDRKNMADQHNLSPIDCITLASIIEKESVKTEEYRRIAGVYINRLEKNWPLQADPTIKYALQQPDIRRVLTKHLEIDSPYNTYKNPGLPPGPIGLPEKTTIQAVLEAEDHNYMYFCAKDDFSGYHVFASTLREHRQNARRYQQALNENGIY
jgi:UPF0755 protein